ncbi:flavin reductase family protein [Photobacterium angustum]|uniref:Flavin reductase family protein n=1 Tax=Photobacterium angustum TaxID=661 RepID=A0A855SGN8_PHOAN|nr:flavin reductase family protein [Photobacterium angustum]KJF83091.1 protein/domain typically associated with flavoprotein oxygenase, DIM6/NTAB family protein [Photobacterium damselae subsp. damselae]KJG29804.1 protein/domain typically associated with flavoprotein oxygenase, DIM6/NTAB family protein [Photobacterium angustum]KJG43069.1 protein/domain typically associated with flavoprotein oxygenase, DIM6/NTAB family protein [Photobacterium angustum]KJG47401.1 protein/domain typically associate
MYLDLSTQSPTDIYHLMTQAIIPRPIAWVLTDSGEHNYNLAPFSYFTPVASNPPLLMFSVGKKPSGEIKDTTRNVITNKKMVVHIANIALAEQVTQTAATLEHGESEVEQTHLELTSFNGFELPRLKDCPIAFGCNLYEVKEIGETPQSLIFAEIEQIYIDEEVIDSEQKRLVIEALKVNPLSRLGGSEYAVLERAFSVARPK